MIKALSSIEPTLYHYVASVKTDGAHAGLSNASSMTGDCTRISGDATGCSGDCSRAEGDVSNLSGDISNLCGVVSALSGDATGIVGCASIVSGDIDSCELSAEDRQGGQSIENLIADGE